jgi:hypothetical protein
MIHYKNIHLELFICIDLFFNELCEVINKILLTNTIIYFIRLMVRNTFLKSSVEILT